MTSSQPQHRAGQPRALGHWLVGSLPSRLASRLWLLSALTAQGDRDRPPWPLGNFAPAGAAHILPPKSPLSPEPGFLRERHHCP